MTRPTGGDGREREKPYLRRRHRDEGGRPGHGAKIRKAKG